MLGLGFDQLLSKGGGAIVDRDAKWLEHLGVGVLRRVLHQLGKRIDQRKRILTYVVQLVPQPVELRLLRLVEH